MPPNAPGRSLGAPSVKVEGHVTPLVRARFLTDPGKARSLNEDNALTLPLQSGGLYAVADGMGGHAAGEVASKLALDELRDAYEIGSGPVPARLAWAVQAANTAVFEHATGSEAGMGTTLAALLVDGGVGLVANVGDSRVYLYRDGTLTRLTRDHSWVAEQVRLGFISEREAREHQWRNVVSNALGSEEQVRLDLLGVPLERGDRLLLCSDGLTAVVDDDDLADLLGREGDLNALLPLLVTTANDRGGPDNITAVVVDIRNVTSRPRYALPTLHKDGPQAAAAYGVTERRGLFAYAALAALYLTLLGMVLLPDRQVWVAALGLLALTGMLIASWLKRRADAPKAEVHGDPPSPHQEPS